MVYMSRMPIGGKGGQSRHGERNGHRLKQSAGTNGSDDQIQCLYTGREYHAEFFCGSGIIHVASWTPMRALCFDDSAVQCAVLVGEVRVLTFQYPGINP